jgi:hypothetical protein
MRLVAGPAVPVVTARSCAAAGIGTRRARDSAGLASSVLAGAVEGAGAAAPNDAVGGVAGAGAAAAAGSAMGAVAGGAAFRARFVGPAPAVAEGAARSAIEPASLDTPATTLPLSPGRVAGTALFPGEAGAAGAACTARARCGSAAPGPIGVGVLRRTDVGAGSGKGAGADAVSADSALPGREGKAGGASAGPPEVSSRSSGVPRSNCRNNKVARPNTATLATARRRQEASLAAWRPLFVAWFGIFELFWSDPSVNGSLFAIHSGVFSGDDSASPAVEALRAAAARACASTASRSAGDGRAGSWALAS